MEEQIAAFEREHAGVRVEWVDVPYDALERKLIAAAAAGRAPDVVNMADLNFARFAALGAFADISEKTPGSARERYVPGALGLCLIGGRVMALPWYVNPQARIVNAELLERGGLSVGTLAGDWRGLKAQAGEFRRKTGEYLFSQPLGEESQIPIMMLGEGLVPLREEGGRLVADLLRVEIVEYVRGWVGAYREGWLPREAATKGHAHLTELYQEGRLAVINTGPNFVERIRDVSPRVFERTVVLKGAVGELGRVHMPVMVLAVVSQSRQPELAARLAWHLTGPEAELGLSKMVAVMPSARSALEDPYFAEAVSRSREGEMAADAEGRLQQARAVAASTTREAVAFTPALECWPEMRRAFEEEIKRALLDGAEVEGVLARAQGEWDRILGEATPATMDAVPRPERIGGGRPG